MAWITPIVGGLIKNVNFGKDYLHGRSPIPLIASIEVNNICNQHCSYCYISKRESIPSNFSKQDMFSILEKCVELGIQFITISGREPLLDRESVKYLQFLDTLKVKYKNRFTYGFNTNGINIGKYFNTLKKLRPDWITVSMDGLQKFHDSMRGIGNFDLVDNNIKKLLEIPYFQKRLEVTTTMTSATGKAEIFHLTAYLQKIGICYHSITPVIEKLNNGEHMQPDSKSLIDFYISKRNIITDIQLYFILMKNAINGKILLDYPLERAYENLMDQDCFKISNLDKFYILLHNATRYFRITSDGYLIRGINLFDKNYKEVSAGRPSPDTLQALIKENFKRDRTLNFYRDYFDWLN